MVEDLSMGYTQRGVMPDSVLHAFGSKRLPLPDAIAPYWEHRPTKTQVHANTIVEVIEPKQACGHADGLYTSSPGILLPLVTADCMPVLMARKDGSCVAALHVGWRGLLSGIVKKMIGIINGNGDDVSNWIAVVGPAIDACCFEVGAEVLNEFHRTCDLPAEVIEPRVGSLDLKGILSADFTQAGIGALSVDYRCTKCTQMNDGSDNGDYYFHSFRRDKNKDIQWSGIVILEEEWFRRAQCQGS